MLTQAAILKAAGGGQANVVLVVIPLGIYSKQVSIASTDCADPRDSVVERVALQKTPLAANHRHYRHIVDLHKPRDESILATTQSGIELPRQKDA